MPTPTAKSQSATKSHAREKSALDLLKADHKQVNDLLAEFEEAHGAGKKRKLASEICNALTIHAQVEEELFYPEVKAALKDKELVPEATVEHGVIKDLIAQLEGEGEDANSEMFDARVKVLGEYVKHHVKEEEKEIFPKLKESSLDLVELGERMAARFEDLRSAKH
jgi:hemerythrin superfamily protein